MSLYTHDHPENLQLGRRRDVICTYEKSSGRGNLGATLNADTFAIKHLSVQGSVRGAICNASAARMRWAGSRKVGASN
jgi:hypothetical protein